MVKRRKNNGGMDLAEKRARLQDFPQALSESEVLLSSLPSSFEVSESGLNQQSPSAPMRACYGSAQQPMVKRKRGRPRKDASLKRGRPRKDASLLRTAQSDKSLHENECASPLTQARRTFCSYRSSEEADKTMYPESRSPTPALGMDKDCFREMEGEVLQQTEDVASTDISLFLPSDSTRSEDVDVQKDVNQTNVTNHKGRGGNVRELQCPKCGRKYKRHESLAKHEYNCQGIKQKGQKGQRDEEAQTNNGATAKIPVENLACGSEKQKQSQEEDDEESLEGSVVFGEDESDREGLEAGGLATNLSKRRGKEGSAEDNTADTADTLSDVSTCSAQASEEWTNERLLSSSEARKKFKATNSDDGVNGLASIAANCEGEGVSDMAQRGKVSCAAVVDDAAEQASAEAATFLEHDMWPTSDALTSDSSCLTVDGVRTASNDLSASNIAMENSRAVTGCAALTSSALSKDSSGILEASAAGCTRVSPGIDNAIHSLTSALTLLQEYRGRDHQLEREISSLKQQKSQLEEDLQEATNAHLIQVLALRKELEAKDAKIDTLQKRADGLQAALQTETTKRGQAEAEKQALCKATADTLHSMESSFQKLQDDVESSNRSAAGLVKRLAKAEHKCRQSSEISKELHTLMTKMQTLD